MKYTMTTSEIATALRQDSNAAWSAAGAWAIAEYMEEYEKDSREEMEFDAVAIRCDYSEYANLQEWAVDYFGGEDKAKAEFEVEELDSDEAEEAIRNYIQDNGTLIEFDGGVIATSF